MAMREDEFIRITRAMHEEDPFDTYARHFAENTDDLGFNLPPICRACAGQKDREHICCLRFYEEESDSCGAPENEENEDCTPSDNASERVEQKEDATLADADVEEIAEQESFSMITDEEPNRADSD